ncbi:MAG: UvrD-helicase domain-containing protein, partial [Clostridiales Family XIII bacterium]|nr:UvrD-helicase domain-containing protein [Clostridiales Family XIII bacterium]
MSKTLVLASTFMDAFASIPNQDQKKVNQFLNKFRNNPSSPSINYEKIIGAKDNKMRSVRITDDYRSIIAQYPDTYLLLWIDHHDNAYKWAKNRKCEINPTTKNVQLYQVSDQIPTTPQSEKLLFSDIQENDILALGVPQEQLKLVYNLVNFNDLINAKDAFPTDAYEYLNYLATGAGTLHEILDLINQQRKEDLIFIKESQDSKIKDVSSKSEITTLTNDSVPDINTALSLPASQRDFHVIGSEIDLTRTLSVPLEKWRIFLHPHQQKSIQKNYSGPVRVLGGAGTGKTVVALHRAKWLANNSEIKGKILFTTFTKNLAADINQNLRKICNSDELKRIDVINIDAFVSRFLRHEGYDFKLIYGQDLTQIWADAVELYDSLKFKVTFYQDEYSKVVAFNNAYSKQDYLKAPRIGRGTRLDRKKREEVWKVFEEYRKILQEKKVRDIETALFECMLISEKNKHEPYYSSIVVDEGQDFSMNAFRFLRSLAGSEHNNDIFIVGDTHQRIYKHKVVLGKCGINIVGRSSYLKLNYRTSEDTRKFAYAILKGLDFDDMDAGLDNGVSESIRHSIPPVVKHFKNLDKELKFIITEIQELVNKGTEPKNICLVARTNNILNDYKDRFSKNGITFFEVKPNKVDDPKFEGVRLATMHRVKGLEFEYVFVVSANDRIIPLLSA